MTQLAATISALAAVVAVLGAFTGLIVSVVRFTTMATKLIATTDEMRKELGVVTSAIKMLSRIPAMESKLVQLSEVTARNTSDIKDLYLSRPIHLMANGDDK